MALRALARVNLAAIERNVAHLRAGLAGDAQLCAVVKANASGHGAVPAARAVWRAARPCWRWRRSARRPSCGRRASGRRCW